MSNRRKIELPRIVTGFDIHVNGINYGKRNSRVVLPSSAPNLVEYHPGGLHRPIKVKVGESADWNLEFSVDGFDLDAVLMDACMPDDIPVMIFGSVRVGESCEEIPFTAKFLGQRGDTDGNTLELNQEPDSKTVEFAIVEAEYILNGQQIYYENVLDMVRIVNGKDTLEQRRRNLGRA